MPSRRDRRGSPWHLLVLTAGAIALVVLGLEAIGPPTSSSRTSRELVAAADGVVQSTVTGTGNVEARTDVDANFQASGTLSQVLVHVGQHVGQGQLLATLDPTSAQLAVDQAQASLTSAEDQLSQLESESTTTGTSTTASAPVTTPGPEFVAITTTTAAGTSATTTPAGGTGHSRPPTRTTTTPTTTTPTTTTPTTTTPTTTRTTPRATTTTRAPSPPTRTSASGASTRSSTSSAGTTTRSSAGSGANQSGSGSGASQTPTTAAPTPATVASAQAAVDSAQANLRSAQDALSKTGLYAPAAGTIVSLANLVPGDSVSAGSNGAAASASGSSASSSTGSGGAGGGGGGAGSGSLGAGSSGASSAGSGTSGSSSTPFAEIVDTGTMTMTVALSESDITHVQDGQAATVSIDALSGVELAAHVSAISTVGSSSNGVVSYNATLTLDQNDSRVKPGMSASATIITAQAQGVTIPVQAITGSGALATVEVMHDGKPQSQSVVVGLRGSTRAQIVSGLSAGQQVVITITLPPLGSSSATTGSAGTLGSGRLGGGGFGGGGGFAGRAGLGAGAGAALRGGG